MVISGTQFITAALAIARRDGGEKDYRQYYFQRRRRVPQENLTPMARLPVAAVKEDRQDDVAVDKRSGRSDEERGGVYSLIMTPTGEVESIDADHKHGRNRWDDDNNERCKKHWSGVVPSRG